jgi:hypothetical protein
MSDIKNWRREKSVEHLSLVGKDRWQSTSDLCEKALDEAKAELHPLLRDVEVKRLEQRSEFLEAFKSALERRIARKLAACQPGVQAVFRYDETRIENVENWDGSIRLLVKVPRLSTTIRVRARRLNRDLMKQFRQMSWERFLGHRSILEVHQVTPHELRHSIGYGAMFCAVYNVPVQVWPPEDPKHQR